jgi:hypothetical protein
MRASLGGQVPSSLRPCCLQFLHGDRLLFNARGGDDLARFLADPRREDIEAHLENLTRLATERKYRPGWCWHMLRLRWGEAALQRHGITGRGTPGAR